VVTLDLLLLPRPWWQGVADAQGSCPRLPSAPGCLRGTDLVIVVDGGYGEGGAKATYGG
jgi:hypothetical protein